MYRKIADHWAIVYNAAGMPIEVVICYRDDFAVSDELLCSRGTIPISQDGELIVDSTSHDLKSAAHQIIDALPAGATWDDLMYRVYVRQCIDAGLDDAKHDRVVDVDDIREQFGLKR